MSFTSPSFLTIVWMRPMPPQLTAWVLSEMSKCRFDPEMTGTSNPPDCREFYSRFSTDFLRARLISW